jgi:SAM-dependent methyltransferase
MPAAEGATSAEARYFAANSDFAAELDRLRLIEAAYDPWTIRHLNRLGVAPGWHCLEVGAGAGSVARWLADRVGPTGRVVATDADPRFLDTLAAGTVEVCRHDVTVDELERDTFDFIHCRFLLMHLDDPEAALRRMAAALRPGGWLLVEETDNDVIAAADDHHPLAGPFSAVWGGTVRFLEEAGIMHMTLGRSVPAMMASAGLVDVADEGVTRLVRGGEPLARILRESWVLFEHRLAAGGVASDDELAAVRRAYDDPTFAFRNCLMVSSSGRRR